ncbi:MAG: DUF2793 domain-containing protein [Alphaproteobacteria bacterium]|nr:DUF2793 domain-containing protein [Alphaproteobacteria bacterium]
MDFSAKLSLPYLLPNQAQKHVTLNESLRALDAIVQLSVVSTEQRSPPDAPSEGDRYIVAAPGAAGWTDADGQIAAFQDGSWAFYAPQTGWTAWAEENAQLMAFDGDDWIDLTAGSGGSSQETLGINAAADTASVLFQSNWSGRAEMGLTGSDDFLLKTSADGQSFAPTLLAQSSTGNVGIGTWSPTAKLHVDGALRLGVAAAGELPDAAGVGAGGLMFVEQADGAVELAYSDGASWRSVRIGSVAS